MFTNTTDGSIDNEAVKIANSFKPFVKKWFDEWNKNCVRCKKMTVTTAPDGNFIGVKDAFSDTEFFIPYMSCLNDAEVGEPIWCNWLFNNMQTLYADRRVSVVDSDGYMPVSGGTFNGNVYFSGDVYHYGNLYYDILYGGAEIPSNTDLNTYKQPCCMNCNSSATAQTLSNAPTTSAFKFMTIQLLTSQRLYQICMENSTALGIYIRYYNGHNWSAWKKVSLV